MDHVRIVFAIADAGIKDIFIARLSAAGYDGFEETDTGLLAYIPAGEYEKSALEEIAGDVQWEKETVQQQNWNALWESNFEPVTIADFCTIRADFHNVAADTEHELIITPKMSFGTGHHATTQLMIMLMRGISFAGKRVLDFGSGTGVLAILAEKLGATDITALDNDTWCAENAAENIARNGCRHIMPVLGSLAQFDGKADVILANINRHILLENMENMRALLHPDGTLLMSGLLAEDEDIICAAAKKAGMKQHNILNINGWIALHFER